MKRFMIFLTIFLLSINFFTVAQIPFGSPTNYSTGTSPFDIFVADFDGDGDNDLVTANSDIEFNDISVFINIGDGSFYPAVHYNLGLVSEPLSVFASNLDWDGDKDLAVADGYINNNVSILPNNGNGTFEIIGRNYPVGSYPFSIFASDLDGDYDNDLVTANYNALLMDDISVLMNRGDGTFIPAVGYAIDILSSPSSVFVSDLDGDDDKDLVIADPFYLNRISILPNNGDGTFQLIGLNYAIESEPWEVIASDLNNDMNNDLVTANSSGNGAIAVLLNSNNGLFNDPVYYQSSNDFSGDIVASDLDGDGDKDVVAVMQSLDHKIIIFSNNGDGTFMVNCGYLLDGPPQAISALDLDGDGDNDLAVTCSGPEGSWVSVLLNQTNPAKGAISGIIKNMNGVVLSGASVKVFVTDDFGEYSEFAIDTTNANGEYFVDDLFPGRYSLEVYRNGYYKQTKYGIVPEGNVGTTNFTLELAGFIHDSDYVAGDKPESVFSSDLNGDGANDLAVVNFNSNNVSIFLNYGNGKYQQAVNYEVGDNPMWIFSADLDGDSDEDLAITNYESNSVSILFNNGNGTFQSPIDYGVGFGPRSIFASDLDGDWDYDLAVTNFSYTTVSILENNGNGTFQSAVDYTVGYYPSSIYACDLDGDSDNDLAVTMGYTNEVSILENNSDGTFQSPVNYEVGTAPTSIFAADLEHDGDLDLAVANVGSDNVSILKNIGDGTFLPKVNYPAGEGPLTVFASDFDGDSFDDLAFATTANPICDSISILLNNGNATFQMPVRYIVGHGCSSVFAADFDDDGDIDVAATNASSDNISVLLNQSIITGVESSTEFILPERFSISQNYPNPFNPGTKIRYSVPQSSHVIIKVFDVLGNEIETLVNEEKSVGTYELTWDAANLPSGVYFYQLKAGDYISTKKMVLLQ